MESLLLLPNEQVPQGYGRYRRGSLSSVWCSATVVLSKAELRRSRIAADLSTAEDGDMSFEEASVALHSIAMGRTALEGHYIGPPPTLLPTLLMFHGRFQRLVRVFSFSFFFLFLFFFQPPLYYNGR